jgi:hypothetical protein
MVSAPDFFWDTRQMTTTASARRPLLSILIIGAVLALLAYFYWPRKADVPSTPTGPANASTAAPLGPLLSTGNGPLPPGAVSNVGGIPLDAEGHRIVNAAGLPISNEPLPQAKPIPVKAPTGTVIGYTKDAQGNSQPLRAGDLKQIPNTPGSFAVVDMWADGGPTVVPATEGKHLTEAEVKRLEDAERAREQAGSKQP